mmetsp:Transcript_7486/g.10435  ORF Transcript_7486/g.10435 Transcript_7486/m.10435 type:complete len:242 (+) Transcript_7486:741-1466(+)
MHDSASALSISGPALRFDAAAVRWTGAGQRGSSRAACWRRSSRESWQHAARTLGLSWASVACGAECSFFRKARTKLGAPSERSECLRTATALLEPKEPHTWASDPINNAQTGCTTDAGAAPGACLPDATNPSSAGGTCITRLPTTLAAPSALGGSESVQHARARPTWPWPWPWPWPSWLAASRAAWTPSSRATGRQRAGDGPSVSGAGRALQAESGGRHRWDCTRLKADAAAQTGTVVVAG